MAAESTVSGLGRTIGSYRLEEEIGRGGMGVVYRAARLDTGETVALKLMLPEISANQQFRARFIREATLGSDLDHPNIVPIYDAGEADGELYIAMRLVEGRDLKSVIEEGGPLEPKRALSILRQVASALDSAHEAGIVHHDIKPQNLLISESELADRDLVFITDFGLVRPAGSESTSSRTGNVFGSIQYMAPEQVEGMACDGRADVYALGCVIYECLTGEIPFDRPNEVAVLWAHVHEQPERVTARRSELPGGLDTVIATALAKHPDDRYLTCGELVEDFEKGLQRKHRPVVMPVLRPLVKRIPRTKTEREVWAPNYFPELSRVKKITNRVNWIQVAGVTAILCTLAAALVQFAHPRGIPGAVGDVAMAIGDSVLGAGQKISSVLSSDEPDGGVVEDRRRQRSADGANTDPRGQTGSVAGSEEANRPAPRLKTASVGGDGVKKVIPPGSPPLTGKILFESTRESVGASYDYGIYVMNADGTGLRQVYNDPLGDEHDAVWSRDGQRIAFVQGDSLHVMRSDGTGRQTIFRGGSPQDPAWSPDGTRIAFSHHARTDAGPMDGGWDVMVTDVDQGGARPLTGIRGFDRFPTWHGSRIAFSADRRGNVDIYSAAPDGKDLRRLTQAASPEIMPEFSPGGDKIAYVVSRGGGFNVFTKRTRLGAAETRITSTFDAFAPAWSPDGNWIAFSGARSKGFSIWGENDILLVPARGGATVRWTNDPLQPGSPEVWDFNPSWI